MTLCASAILSKEQLKESTGDGAVHIQLLFQDSGDTSTKGHLRREVDLEWNLFEPSGQILCVANDRYVEIGYQNPSRSLS